MDVFSYINTASSWYSGVFHKKVGMKLALQICSELEWVVTKSIFKIARHQLRNQPYGDTESILIIVLDNIELSFIRAEPQRRELRPASLQSTGGIRTGSSTWARAKELLKRGVTDLPDDAQGSDFEKNTPIVTKSLLQTLTQMRFL